MSQRKLFTFLVIVLAATLPAQVTNYLPGYVITKSNDTIYCQINRDSDLLLSTRVKYLQDGQQTEASPKIISAFYFSDLALLYQSISHTYVDQLTGVENTTDRFAQVLFQSKTPLFKLNRFASEYHKRLAAIPSYVFYTIEGGEYRLLEVVEETINESRFRVLEKYKGVLKYLFREQPAVVRKVNRTLFKDDDLTEIFRDYAGKSNDDQREAELLKIKQPTKVFHSIGAILPVLSLSSDVSLDNGYGFSYRAAFSSPAKSNALEVAVGLDYYRIETFIDEALIDGGNLFQNRSTTSTTLRIPVVADYFFSRQSKVQPFISFQLSGNLTHLDRAADTNFFFFRNDGTRIERLFQEITVDEAYAGLAVGGGLGVTFKNLRFSINFDTEFLIGTQKISLNNDLESRQFAFAHLSYYIFGRR